MSRVGYRLGRLPHDPERVAAARAARPHRMSAEAPPPARLDRGGITFRPWLAANDTEPTCTAAGLANAATAFGLVRAGAAPTIVEAAISTFYSACVGCADTDAARGATDGAVMLDVLMRAEADGFGVGAQTPLVPLYTVPDITDRLQLASMIDRFGGLYAGVTLTERDMDAFAAGAVLDDDGTDASAPVGGHCLVPFDYLGLSDTDTLRMATWGMLATATWRWLMRRLDGNEGYGLDWPQETGV